jgi:hypothetical protein
MCILHMVMGTNVLASLFESNDRSLSRTIFLAVKAGRSTFVIASDSSAYFLVSHSSKTWALGFLKAQLTVAGKVGRQLLSTRFSR